MPVNLEKSIPTTLDEAVNSIVCELDPAEIADIKNHQPEEYHFMFGMNMRNCWGLWHDSVLAKWFKDNLQIWHADDMSGLILSAVSAKVRGEEFDLKSKVLKYQQYWRDQNINGPSEKM